MGNINDTEKKLSNHNLNNLNNITDDNKDNNLNIIVKQPKKINSFTLKRVDSDVTDFTDLSKGDNEEKPLTIKDKDDQDDRGKIDILTPITVNKQYKKEKTKIEYETTENNEEYNFDSEKPSKCPVKFLLNSTYPDFTYVKDEDMYTLWLDLSYKFVDLIKSFNEYNISKRRIILLHGIIEYNLLHYKTISNTLDFKQALQNYVESIWSQDRSIYEQAYYKLDELIAVQSIEGARNMTKLIEVFSEVKNEILKNLSQTPHIGESEYDLNLFHKEILRYLEISDLEKYFLDVKRCLILYKQFAIEKDSKKIRKVINSLKVLFALFDISKTRSFKSLKGQIEKDELVLIANFLDIEDPPADKNDIIEFNKRIKNVLVGDSPFYLETMESIKFYYLSAYKKDRTIFLASVSEFKKIFHAFTDITHYKVKIDFSTIDSREDLILAWKSQEKALMLLESVISGIHRKDIRNLHDFIFYTIELEDFSVSKLKNQLINYYNALLGKNNKEVLAEMGILTEICNKENLIEEERILKEGKKPEPPRFLSVKKQYLLDAWINFIREPYCKRIICSQECPINRINIKLITYIVAKKCKNLKYDLVWMKRLMQNFADSLWSKQFTQLEETYEDIINFQILNRNY